MPYRSTRVHAARGALVTVRRDTSNARADPRDKLLMTGDTGALASSLEGGRGESILVDRAWA